MTAEEEEQPVGEAERINRLVRAALKAAKLRRVVVPTAPGCLVYVEGILGREDSPGLRLDELHCMRIELLKPVAVTETDR